jgi:hypothetical protein
MEANTARTRRLGAWSLLLLSGLAAVASVACGGSAESTESRGVYRSGPAGKGPNAVIRGRRSGEVRVWGPQLGTVTRSASDAGSGASTLGQTGALWRVDGEVPALPKPFAVDAALVERAGFRLREVLGTHDQGNVDAARTGGVYVRSTVKVRRRNAPPVYLVTGTVDTVGAGRMGGPPDVRAGENCRAAVAMLDLKLEKVLANHLLDDATATCAVPVIAAAVDIDADGVDDALVYGQQGNRGFRAWFRLAGETLVPGPRERWDDIP